ncbi:MULTISPECIES: hypothetical protein [unclassified Phenylobacterium]|uniref:hypothetical protein n=1 Tax=unclassified Phenylobacterium TaxID=2640670 RepID=UPI0022B36607|nr:hypothetical protein [Phenylobacterium sp. NIBR 498073]MBS0488612.1 hypothetical protein [Pseudomonadota bacterium]WGU38523.1 hypothetical protein O4N75_12740 [Phenylobacterium sp. NIBR 498073]
MRLPALARKTHKWLALIIAVQAVFWMLSGLYMTAVHINIIHGDHLVRAPRQQPIALDGLVEPTSLVPGGTRSVRLDTQLGQPVYIVDAIPGRMLFDARTGQMLSPLDEKAARDRAVALYAGKGAVTKVELLDTAPSEIKGRQMPIWRVEFEGMWKPTIYIAPQTGELSAKRHDLWRIFDFVWMFHIMDYEERTDMNNTLLRVATWMAVATSATGGWLLLYSFRRRRRARKAA